MADIATSAPASIPAPLWRRHAIALVIFAALAVVPFIWPERYVLSLVGRAMVFGIAALSLDLILGYGAMVSFGHAAFLGLGGYAVAILSAHGIDEAAISFPVAMLVGAAFALVTGAISLKTRGVYFIMITLAFGQMAFFTATSLSAYGGDDGLRMFSRSDVFGTRLLRNETSFYFVVLGVLLGVYLLLRAIVGSRFGRVLRGAKENERRMRALGFDPFRYRLAAYVISGAICALAGALFANLTLFVSPAYMSWQRSGDMIAMVVAGGLGTLNGAIIGAIGVLLIEEWLAELTQHWKALFGPLVVLVAIFARGGLVKLIDRGAGR
ncbi:branched-chain amino acid ABC transporter permease [Phreatobacter aquaticus]|uniref:Branched-chain amino acid ABC transporter permease n=1 Tax=Phreatobacter aquaticus TaxID=2570229 RepID=A0A4D7QEY0_9HYPH|nr:branched-chain amino acid ABC transporter permease [Phreatobacter aquaticus]QCK86500.1 branched-chain amino acid ABC transporter permease [Phreatobacter aquaticus]